MTYNSFDFGWPWMGLGGAVVLLILLFKTDLFINSNQSRWKDTVWLSWFIVPVYLVHQFEEYTMHITNGQYDGVAMFFSERSPVAAFLDTMELPMAHFPLMNIMFVWVALPIAAFLSKKNPVIGLSGYGFLIVNGMAHLLGGVALGMSPLENPGFFTGTIVFIPLTLWMSYICLKTGQLSKKKLILSLISGIIGHIALASCYLFAIMGLPAGVLIADVVVAFTPTIVAWIFCKIFKIKK